MGDGGCFAVAPKTIQEGFRVHHQYREDSPSRDGISNDTSHICASQIRMRIPIEIMKVDPRQLPKLLTTFSESRERVREQTRVLNRRDAISARPQHQPLRSFARLDSSRLVITDTQERCREDHWHHRHGGVRRTNDIELCTTQGRVKTRLGDFKKPRTMQSTFTINGGHGIRCPHASKAQDNKE
jgi:hypothetical protein